MHLNLPSVVVLLLAGLAAGAVAPTTSVTFQIQATHLLPNPYALPPSTHATLSSFHRRQAAPISTGNAFVFRNVSAGSYLVDFHCPTHLFAPVRLDVVDGEARLTPWAWETYRGNDWDNKGQALQSQNGVFDVYSAGPKHYFMERGKFSVFGILRNPMILLGLVSMAIFLGMPYLVESMDPEMRAEWEERQKSNPMNTILGGAGGQPAPNFDMAAYLAGSSSKKEDGSLVSGKVETNSKKRR